MARHKIALHKLPVILFFLFLSIQATSQNEAANWYFGKYCGLNFSTDPPTVIPSPVFNDPEGGASISDAAGNLLFYTDANTVWNQTQTVMLNGTGLQGDPSSTQSSIIIKQPGSAATYFIFTQQSTAGGLKYSVVDMGLAAGTGSVTVKNVSLYASSCEKLNAVKHCNGTDVWVVTHDFNSTSFRSYLLTASGVNTTPVLSPVSTLYGTSALLGCIKISPTGKKIASVRFADSSVEVYDFNPSTGVVSNPLILSTAIANPYGCEFSPDGTKLYAGSLTDNTVIQWDLCAGNNTAVISSSVSVWSAPQGVTGYLQLAPNGKIYVSAGAIQQLSVINNPNAAGAACNFSYAAQSVGTGSTTLGLPNFVTSYFKEPVLFSFTQNCSVVNFMAPPVSCSASETYTSVAWSFGDPASGALNSSNLPIVTHTFNTSGTYTVKLVVHTACGSDSSFRVITNQTPTVTTNADFSVCSGNTVSLTAGGAVSYTWSTGTTGASVQIIPGSTAGYSVAGSYTNGCTSNSAIVTVSVLPLPVLAVTGSTSVCEGSRALLTAAGAETYTWNTGPHTASINPLPGTTTAYTVSGTVINGCSASVAIVVTVNPVPLVNISNYTICAGQTQTLVPNVTPVNGVNYLWQPGNITTSVFVASPATTSQYTLTASLNGCSATRTNTVVVMPVIQPVTQFSYAPACLNDADPSPVAWPGFNADGNFSSDPALPIDQVSGIITLSLSAIGTYTVLYALPPHNCTAAGTYTAVVSIGKQPTLTISPDMQLAPGGTTTISADGAETYVWSPAVNISCITCSAPAISPLQSTQYCVTGYSNQCQAMACVNVVIGCGGGDLSLPNAFSPNGDGFNDVFCLQGWERCIEKFSVLIFNRWGEKVFESNNPSFCWDGIFNGKALETDVFVYSISASFTNGAAVTKKGNITLLHQ